MKLKELLDSVELKNAVVAVKITNPEYFENTHRWLYQELQRQSPEHRYVHFLIADSFSSNRGSFSAYNNVIDSIRTQINIDSLPDLKDMVMNKDVTRISSSIYNYDYQVVDIIID